MRWPFAKGEVELGLDETEVLPFEPASEIHRSPGLKAAVAHLHKDRQCHILDLGPATSENVDFFSRFHCQLKIIDLLGRLVEEPSSAIKLENAPENFLDELLPLNQQPFDLILAWTVFDHLEREAARHLAARLAQLTHPGAPVFAIISIGQKTSSTGLTFTIRDDDALEYRPAALPQQRSGRFKPAAFSQLLDGFSIDHSVVLRHGYQEYVAVRKGNPSNK